MKRTEAIEWLEVMKEDAIFEQCDALKMAIEALQITEAPIDLVSREDVVIEFIKLFGCIQGVSDIDEWADICQTIVNEIPSAKTSTNALTDLISKADAIEAIYACHPKGRQSVENPKFHYGNWTHGLYDAVCAVKDCEEVAPPLVEVVQGDGRNNMKRYPNCQMRTSLGNCDAIGGFCTSINAPICDAFHELVDVAQGKWIKTVDGNGWNDWYVLKCPFCGATIEDKHYHSWEYNFCPNCGADVRGADHEID